MYKAGVVHHGDDGKSDPLDGQVLYMMGEMGKVSRVVPLSDQWQQLRQLGKWLEDCTLIAADHRIRIGGLRRELFADYHQRSDLTWGPTGIAIQQLYGFDPWEITREGYSRYVDQVKSHRRGIPERCLARIWQQAKCNCKAQFSPSQRRIYSDQLSYLWHQWEGQERRKGQLAAQMIRIVDDLSPVTGYHQL